MDMGMDILYRERLVYCASVVLFCAFVRCCVLAVVISVMRVCKGLGAVGVRMKRSFWMNVLFLLVREVFSTISFVELSEVWRARLFLKIGFSSYHRHRLLLSYTNKAVLHDAYWARLSFW